MVQQLDPRLIWYRLTGSQPNVIGKAMAVIKAARMTCYRDDETTLLVGILPPHETALLSIARQWHLDVMRQSEYVQHMHEEELAKTPVIQKVVVPATTTPKLTPKQSALSCCGVEWPTKTALAGHKSSHTVWECPTCKRSMTLNAKGNHLRKHGVTPTPSTDEKLLAVAISAEKLYKDLEKLVGEVSKPVVDTEELASLRAQVSGLQRALTDREAIITQLKEASRTLKQQLDETHREVNAVYSQLKQIIQVLAR